MGENEAGTCDVCDALAERIAVLEQALVDLMTAAALVAGQAGPEHLFVLDGGIRKAQEALDAT